MNKAPDLQHLDFYESTLNNLTEGVVWTNSDGQVVYSNDASARWFSLSKKELLQRSIYELLPSSGIEEWLHKLIARPDETHEPLIVILNDSMRLNLYAVVSISVGANKYNCFLIKEEGARGSDPNEMLRIISEGTASVIGGDFFKSLAYHVILSTGIRYAIVTECADEAKTRVRTLVYIERKDFLDNFEYDLAGTPCEIVMRGEDYYCTADLDLFFPKDEGVKSYFGVPIFLSNGEVIGHIAIFDTKPMSISDQKMNVLKIFASRAGAEIERKRQDDVIKLNMQRYKSIFDFSPVGLCEEDFSEVKRYVEVLKQNHQKDLKTIFEEYPDEIFACWKRVKRIRVNKAQQELFDVESEGEYADYLQNVYMPGPAKALILTLESGVTEFEREVEIVSKLGNKKIIKVKRVILPTSEGDWSKSLISCVDISPLKETQNNLKKALEEVQQLKEKLEAENVYLQQEIKLEHNFDEIVSKTDVFRKVLAKIEQVADTDATVLILGESGTGKELIARAIHSVGKRMKRPLVKVNCAALPSTLIESELFGHEKGAFTGALNQKIGRFELADGGTLFLDEIGEMPLDLQSKLLRVLQEGEFERVGSSRTIKVDVRVIAATNRDLQTSVNSKEFRADLYYRLNVFPIYSPPLRDRKDDIPVLVTHFCKKYGAKFGRRVSSVSKAVLDTLMTYNWPGNVRELENIIERGLIVSNSDVLEPGDWLPVIVKENSIAAAETDSISSPGNGITRSLENVERQHILDVLKKTNWRIRGENGAAKILNLNPTTLEARMKKLGIARQR